MRDIKFRAWNGKRFLYMGKGGFCDFELSGGEIMEYGGFTWSKEDYPLEQFTGLLDKNGLEIYEGDRVRAGYFYEGDPKAFDEEDRVSYWSDDSEHEVYWGGEYPAFDLKPFLDCDSNIFSHIANTEESIEVIGNIHEVKK